MILKICLFLLKSCNACLFSGFFSTSSMLSFQVYSDFLLFSHAMELSFWSFMYTVDAEIVEITATDFISLPLPRHICLVKIKFSLRRLCCRSEIQKNRFLLWQKPRQLPTAEVNYEDCTINIFML